MKDPVQELLKAAREVFGNIIYDGNQIPVTATFDDSDTYIRVTIPTLPDDEESTDDNYIYNVVLRVEVVTEFLTDEEQETPSNKIMEQVVELMDVNYWNAAISEFQIPIINLGGGDRDTQQDNTSTLIIKRKDFNLKVVQL